MMKNAILALFISLSLGGCTSIPPLDFTVEEVSMIDNRKDAELRSLTVGYASQRQQRIVQSNHEIPPLWKEALQDALNRSLAFKDDSARKVNLSVRIVEFNVPEFGASMTTKVAAIYEIVDRSNGDIIFSQNIDSKGVVPSDYAFLGATRATESVNRAVRNNISDFINQLEAADLDKTVFLGN